MIRPRVLVVGDVIDDVLVRPHGPIRRGTDTPSTIERFAGGSAANTAAWIAAAGVAATVVATVNRDDLDRHRALLSQAGVAPILTASDSPTGTIVVLSEDGERTMLTSRGANAETGPELVPPDLLVAHTRLHLTGHVVTGVDRDAGWRSLLTRAHGLGIEVSVDPGSVGLLAEYGADRFRRLVAGSDLLLPGRDEATLLTGIEDPAEAAAVLAGDHATVVVKCGTDGAIAVHGGRTVRIEAVTADPVDVTGAGDAFAGGLLAGLASGRPLEDALHDAARLAASAVSIPGARPPSPA